MYDPDQPFLEDQLLNKSPTPPVDIVQFPGELGSLKRGTGSDEIPSDSEDDSSAKTDDTSLRAPGSLSSSKR